MIILKNGAHEKRAAGVSVCQECGCEFRWSYADMFITYPTDPNAGVVECPWCKKHIVVTGENLIKEEDNND